MYSKKNSENKNRILTSGWSCPSSKQQYESNFTDWSKEQREKYLGKDCASCKHFLPFNSDWGLCNNSKSKAYLETVFEHFKCLMFQRHD